jgi:hypothetical protein
MTRREECTPNKMRVKQLAGCGGMFVSMTAR